MALPGVTKCRYSRATIAGEKFAYFSLVIHVLLISLTWWSWCRLFTCRRNQLNSSFPIFRFEIAYHSMCYLIACIVTEAGIEISFRYHKTVNYGPKKWTEENCDEDVCKACVECGLLSPVTFDRHSRLPTDDTFLLSGIQCCCCYMFRVHCTCT